MILESDLLNPHFSLDIGVKIILGTIHKLSLQGFSGYAHLITTTCLLVHP